MSTDKRKRGAGTGGRFFVLDRGQWERLFSVPTANRMNLVLAYLVLLAGTGADHRLTKWSVTAVFEHTGMRKDAVRTAIKELLAAGLIERAATWTPTFPHYDIIAGAGDGEGAPIFLSIGIVTGMGETDTSMLRRVRETGDPLLLRLLIDLYGEVTIDATCAVAISAMRGYHNKGPAAEKAMEIGSHAIWELREMDTIGSLSLDRSRYVAKGEAKHDAFWARVDRLHQIGATYREPWLCSNSTADADPICPFDAEVAAFAQEAGAALMDSVHPGRSNSHHGRLVVLPAHHQPPALLYLTRMRIEADTPGRRAAYGERQRIAAHWIEQYDRLETDAEAGIYDNPLRTQAPRPPAAECVPIKEIKGIKDDQGDQVGAELLSNPSNQSGAAG